MPKTAILTDSSSQLRGALVNDLDVEVIPLTVIIDGVEYLDTESAEEGGLSVDRFYAIFDETANTVSTAQPAPATFVDAYERAIASGAEEIVAVLVGADYSGTIDSARLAAAQVDCPVHIVDSGAVSFGLGACVLAAAEARRRGGDAAVIVAAAEQMAAQAETVFLLQGLELPARSGRFAPIEKELEAAVAIPVFWMGGGAFEALGEAGSAEVAADLMVERMLGADGPFDVAIGVAHPATAPIADAMEVALSASSKIGQIIRYAVGPSVAAHAGVGTAGAYYWPAANRGQRPD